MMKFQWAMSVAILFGVAGALPGQELSVAPGDIALVGSRAQQRLLVLNRFADGTHADVTGESEYESLDPKIASVSKFGVVQPRADGSARIVARHDGVETQVRITVSGADDERPIDFRTEVIGALNRGGCNSGACHGSPQGKNGFRLSLRGFDPDLGARFLTRDAFGRRIDRLRPAESLVLRKATGELPHDGGLRFHRTDAAYEVLRRWIAEGARDNKNPPRLERLEVIPSYGKLHTSSRRQRLIVRACFRDGTKRDVTDLAVFSSPDQASATVSRNGIVEFRRTAEAAILVRYLDRIETARLAYVEHDPNFAFTAPSAENYVDELVFAKQRELQLRPAEIASDAIFLRRVHLDVIGAIPSPEEASDFLVSADPQKRRKLIDRLLEREEYAQFWAMKWADVMRGNRDAISERGVHNLHRYLVRSFSSDRPFDELAREIVTSTGNTIHRPAANFYRVSRTPTDTAESFSQLFLGVRIQCAKCHNHPYESITQRDYYGLAASFARVRRKGQRFGLDDEVIYLAPDGEVTMPGVKANVAPTAFGSPLTTPDASADRRAALADWLATPENRYFTHSTVNRIWRHLMGRGIVEPVDDFRDSNPPTNPRLLDALAGDFVEHGYRFKPVIRSILNSRTYQLAGHVESEQSPRGGDGTKYFTQAVVRILEAEQIIDAISMATGIDEKFPGYPAGTKAIGLAEGGIEHKFLQAFGKPVRDVACDCARETEPTLNQVMHLINNPTMLDKIDSPKSRLARWSKAGLTADATVELLYLATLTRWPTSDEQRLAARYVAESDDPTSGLRDLQHALINSNEFLLRH